MGTKVTKPIEMEIVKKKFVKTKSNWIKILDPNGIVLYVDTISGDSKYSHDGEFKNLINPKNVLKEKENQNHIQNEIKPNSLSLEKKSIKCKNSNARIELKLDSKQLTRKENQLRFKEDKILSKELNSKIAEMIQSKDIAGAVSLIYMNDSIIHFATQGKRDIQENKPMEKDTIFQIKSMTKPITSVATLICIEQGKMNLHDPITKYCPEFKELKVMTNEGKLVDPKRVATIEDLMTHTAGFAYSSNAVGIPKKKEVFEMFEKAKIFEIGDPNVVIQRLSTVPLVSHPGEKFNYSVSLSILGIIIERVVGVRLGEFCKEYIFKPLGMKDTHFVCPKSKMKRLSSTYTHGQNLKEKYSDVHHFKSWAEKYLIHFGGGGLVSTAMDYLKFTIMLLQKGVGIDKDVRILKEKSVESMTTNHLPNGELAYDYHGFGYGVYVEINDKPWCSFGEFGWSGLFCTYFWVQPKKKLIGIIMTQQNPYDDNIKQKLKKIVDQRFKN